MKLAERPIHLIGSVGGESAEEVLRLCGPLLGEKVLGLSDGETGVRKFWIHFVLVHTFLPHPDIEVVRKPKGAPGLPDWVPAGYDDLYKVRPRAGFQSLRFDSLHYSRVARESYPLFCQLRDQGVIAKTTRFQQCLPFPEDVCRLFTTNAKDMQILIEAYLDAMVRDVQAIQNAIPPDDLVLQWDINWEVLAADHDDYMEGGAPLDWKAEGDPVERYCSYLRTLTPAVAPGVKMGLHLCYGDLHHQHFFEPKDLGTSVKLANLGVRNSQHTVDFVHMTVPRNRGDSAYFHPLKDLYIGEGTLYAGLVHYTDGVEGTLKRMEMLDRHYDGWAGVATECGLGRLPVDQDLKKKLMIHTQAIERFSARA